jgi:Rad3-related DNA helicase
LGEFEAHRIPDKFGKFRSHQPPAIDQVVALFNSGVKVVMLEAPTGTGKTLISESVRRMVERSAVYTCTTLTLQDQVLDDFPYARVLKGRNNYPTLDNHTITADLCTRAPAKLPACEQCPGWVKGASWDEQPDTWEDEALEGEGEVSLHCHWCHPTSQCPYEVAKGEAMRADLAILNTSYLLHEANGPGRFSKQDLIILDEADMLEGELMSYVEVSLSKYKREKLGVGEPKHVTKEDSWVVWIEERVIPALEREVAGLRKSLKQQGPKPKLLRALKSNNNLLAKVRWLVKPTEDGDVNLTGWVMNNYNGDITFKPIRVSEHGPALLWSHSQKFLLMSATIVSPEQMANDLGLEEGEWAVVHVPSTFPVERRPIALNTVGKLNRETKGWSYKAAADRVVEIAAKHPDERLLVHTVSYELNRIVANRLDRTVHADRIETYFNSKERAGALAKYLDSPNAILLSPSFERGVDLPHDACRVVVVAKIPFPFLGDKQIKARTYGTFDGRQWYSVQTIRSLCQMTGRGMRSAEDWCVSYILDSSFQDLYGPNRRLFPAWWAEAIVWDENDPMWKESVLNGVHM